MHNHGVPRFHSVLLRRAAVAKALQLHGFPVTQATLATKACRGDGPPYVLFGRVPLYRLDHALIWARARLSPQRWSSSEIDAALRR
jgi:hypothetical protein